MSKRLLSQIISLAANPAVSGDSPPITDDLLVYYNPDVDVFSDDIGTTAVNGDNVRQFNDLSGNSNTLTQVSASLQPVYNVGTLGTGLGSMQITASDHLNSTNPLLFTQPDANFTFYLVFKKNELDINHYVVGQSAPLTGNSRIWLRDGYYQIYDSGGTNAFVANTEDTNLTLIAITVNTSGSASEQRYKVYKNGSLLGSTTRDFGNDFRFNKFYGVNWSGISSKTIYCGNMLFYDGIHDATQVGEVSDWLNEKYSIY
jgi:hypothetical protein